MKNWPETAKFDSGQSWKFWYSGEMAKKKQNQSERDKERKGTKNPIMCECVLEERKRRIWDL